MHFSVSGVDVHPLVPPLISLVVSFFTSMGGVSGAFMLLPFQVSILGYTSPSVSATNQVFNVVATPSGVCRYLREGRMVWPLMWTIVLGTLPGVFFGAWIRIEYLPDPKNFKFFAGLVLTYIGVRLLIDAIRKKARGSGGETMGAAGTKVLSSRFSVRQASFAFGGGSFCFSPASVLVLCFFVGILGGIYGIGGGALITPFLVTFFGLPVYTVAGPALMGTFATSVAGVLFYQFLSRFYNGMSVAPDWLLGLLFGLGGFVGIYLGARCQKYVRARTIKLILCVCVLFVAARYIVGFFL
ncbi:sulfite exporter TauE/SafE family protein [Thermodesulfobacteriota bacterium]